MALQPPQLVIPNGGSTLSLNTAGGGRFDFDDGGVYIGGWHEGKAHGHGVCTGPKGQGEYAGSWSYGFELNGVYKWPSGATYEGQWQNGKRHGIGVEYRGNLLSAAKYEGTWANGLQDGYGSETYADGGTYQGQWLRGMRHGYGVRQSAPYGHCTVTKTALSINMANAPSLHSLDTEGEGTLVDHQKRDAAMRGGFVLVIRNTSDKRRNSLSEKSATFGSSILRGLRLKKQKSTGDLDVRSNRSTQSVASSVESGVSTGTSHRGDQDQGDAGSNASFLSQDGDISDPTTTETYMGEWKNDRRCGFGICERSDGIRYEGEWYNNKKYGYGATIFKDGAREEGKYKNNQLVTSVKKKHMFVIRSSKIRDRIDSAIQAAHRAQQIAMQKADIAISRTATSRGKSEHADAGAIEGRADSKLAFNTAKQYGGADVVTQMAIPEVPLRRRLSDFAMRRGTKDQLAQLNTQQGAGSGPQPRPQFLDPNFQPEPFGGRRGSFRNQNGDQSLLNPGQQPSANQHSPQFQTNNQYGSQQNQQRQPQLSVPAMTIQPPTPSVPHGGQHGPQGGYFGHQPQLQPANNSFHHQVQQQPMQNAQQQGYHQQPNQNHHSHQSQFSSYQQPNQGPDNSFSDHFDQYSYNTLVSRYANPGKPHQIPKRRSKTPSINRSHVPSSQLPPSSPPPSASLSNQVPNAQLTSGQHRGPSPSGPQSRPQSGMMGNDGRTPSPSSMQDPRMMASDFSQPALSGPDSGLTSLDVSAHVNRSRPGPGSVTSSGAPIMPFDAMSITSSMLDGSDCPTPLRQQQRTASLYRPAAAGGAGGAGGAALRRKPSVQPGLFKAPAPAMSREEVSAMSHAQREHNRQEADLAERLSRNPFLYLVTPRFKDWLSRQQLIILVLVINTGLAILFFQLLG
ncbi:Junctophilin-3 [Halotydeus destructor]|nr:Junctophilin-3 [Halotydeus destructor]